VVAVLNIADRGGYARYEEGFMDIFSKHAGQVLAVDETPRVIEGDWPHMRTVLVSFPSAEDFDAWYGSREYQDLAQHRLSASTASVAMLNGLS
jgi:uncharacterized protein (DUF1330 family)